jgi:translocation and assembly module TamB
VTPTESPALPARGRWRKYLLIGFGAAGVAALALFLYVNTNSFQAMVRRRLVAEVERITGGRAEVGSFHTTPFRLQIDVRNLTVHGREAATDLPLAHADRIVARLKITSLLRSELAFNELILEQPVVHVIVYPDGSTNFPQRKATNTQATIEQLFALSIDRFDVRHGHMVWDDRIIPLDLSARDTSLQMDYSYLRRRYDGRLLLGFVDSKLLDYKPFASMTILEFSLGTDSADITSLRWNSGHSHLSGSGQVTNFRHPHLKGSYYAQVDLTEAAAVARRHDLRTGALELKGEGEWSLDQFAASGLLTLRDLGWRDDPVSISKASLSSGYTVSDQQLKLSKMQGRIFGGSFTGEGEWNQWLAPEQHLSTAVKKTLETATISAAPPFNKSRQKSPGQKPAGKPAAIQSALLQLRLRDLSAEEIATALNAPEHPLQILHPTGSASGTVEARWKGTRRDGEIQFALDVTPPAHPVHGQLTLSGQARGVYYAASNTLDLPQFTLTTPTSRMQASGELSAASALRLSVSTTSLADWLPLLSMVRGPALFPVVLNGRATFNGNLSGSLVSPELAGNVSVEDFDINIPATAGTHAFQTHWDSLSAAVQASFESVALRNATLRRDDTSAEFEASATLLHGHFTGDSNFTLRANLHNTEVAALQALAGYSYPISGKTDLFVEASGTFSDPQGEGQIHFNRGSFYGEAIQQFDSDFHIGHGEIAFDNLHLFHDDSVTTGSAAYNPTTHAFHLNLAGNNVDLSHIRQLDSHRVRVEGRANFTLKGDGTPDAPGLTADLHIQNLTLDHELTGDLDLHGVTQGRELRITGDSHLQRGSLAVSGAVRLRDDYPAKLSFRLDQTDLDSLWLAYFRGKLTGHSAVGGTVDFAGPLRQPAQWTLAGNLSVLSLDVEHVKLHNQDPIRLSLTRQTLNLEHLHLRGEGTDLTGHGSVQLAGEGALDLTAEGRLDLSLLSSFDPDLNSSGSVIMNLTVGGTWSEPLPQGSLRVANAAISYAGLPSGLNELNGSLLFTREQVHIETLTAHAGGGTLDLKGDASYFNQQLNFNLTAAGKDVRLRYPPGVSSTADAQLHWVGTRSSSTFSGDISVNKMAVTPGFDFGSYLDRSRQFVAIGTANSPLNNIKLDVHIQTSPELQMRTAVARLSGDADLRLRGTAARPALLGRVDVLEGRATFHGIHFTLERGDITFSNPVAIEPQLNLQASSHVRNYDLNITVTGTPDHGLNINYRSEPPLPKSDIIALLALGRTGEESATLEQSGQSAFSDQASALILNQALNDSATSRFQRLFGASNIKIDPQGLTTETNPISNGPQITIEQQFANNVSLTYSTNVSQSSEQIIQGQYYINRNLSVVGTRDQNGVVSFDLQIRRRKK